MHLWMRTEKLERGGVNTGALYIIIILLIITGVAYLITGPTPTQTRVNTGTEVTRGNVNQKPINNNQRLQLYSFGGATITPPATGSCRRGGINTRPEIIVYYSPQHAKAISNEGQIKIWVNDAKPPFIAPGEIVTRNTGTIVTKGRRDELAPDGFRIAPAMYIFPQTAEAGGQPYYPTTIKGSFNNSEPRVAYGMERIPASINVRYPHTVQYGWNVRDLGLQPGSYQLQFLVMDGNGTGRGVGCITIRIYEAPGKRFMIPAN